MEVRVAERIEGRYEVQGVPFGKVYAWRPGRVVLECDCGERLTLADSPVVCKCDTEHAATIQEVVSDRRLGDEALHPWRYTEEREDVRLPF